MQQKHITAVVYVLLAGFLSTFMTYYLLLQLMGALEQTQFIQIGALLTTSSPIIGPIVGSLLYFKFVKSSRGLWKLTLLYSLLFSITLEIYLFYFDSLWSGFGLIVGTISGVVLSFISYKKVKSFRNC